MQGVVQGDFRNFATVADHEAFVVKDRHPVLDGHAAAPRPSGVHL
jgi:hypothetical protein